MACAGACAVEVKLSHAGVPNDAIAVSAGGREVDLEARAVDLVPNKMHTFRYTCRKSMFVAFGDSFHEVAPPPAWLDDAEKAKALYPGYHVSIGVWETPVRVKNWRLNMQ